MYFNNFIHNELGQNQYRNNPYPLFALVVRSLHKTFPKTLSLLYVLIYTEGELTSQVLNYFFSSAILRNLVCTQS